MIPRHPFRARRRCLWTLLVLLGAVGCAPDSIPRSGVAVTDSAGVVIVRHEALPPARTCDLGPEIQRFGSQGDSLTDLFRVMDATRLPTGQVAVLNAGSHQVKVFEESGELAYQFGRRGDGPGEFRANLWSLDLLGTDTLVVGESRTWRYSRFRIDGAFIDAVEPSPHQIERPRLYSLLPDSRGFLLGMTGCCTPDQGFETEDVHILAYDPGGRLQDTVAVFAFTEIGYLNREAGYVGGPIFAGRGALGTLPDDRFIYAPPRLDRLDIYSPQGERERSIRWSEPDSIVSQADVDAWRAAQITSLGDRPATPFFEATVAEDRPVATRFPSHDGILVGTDSRLWVKRARRPRDEGPDRWRLFSPEGEFVCHVQTPVEGRVLEAGENYVLIRTRNDLDVEYVEAYSLAVPIDH